MYGTKPMLGFAIGPTIPVGAQRSALHSNGLLESELQ